MGESSEVLELIQQSRRLVLLLGQTYLHRASPSLKHPLLDVIGSGSQAKALTDWWLSEPRPVAERAQILDRASRLFSFGPEWTALRTLPWSAAFTSSIDGVIRRLLECDGRRQVHQWFAPAARPSEHTLSVFRLFGSVERDSGPELPPGTTDALRARRSGASDMLRTLGEVIGPKGLFVIEGWQPTEGDWLRVRDLAAALVAAQLDSSQVLLTGIHDADRKLLEGDDDFADLLARRVVVLDSQPFSTVVTALAESGHLLRPDVRLSVSDAVAVRVLTSFTGVLRTPKQSDLSDVAIPRDEFRQLSETFKILAPLEVSEPVSGTPPELRRACQRFLEAGSDQQLARVRQFAFRRPFVSQQLIPAVQKALDSASPQDHTIVVSGQSGCGKTTILALLAVELREAGLPVVYVPRTVIPPSQPHLDRFAQLLEAGKSQAPLVVIWDGLEPPDAYQKLSRYFGSKGRRALVIGSSYELTPMDSTRRRASRDGRSHATTSTTTLAVAVSMSPEEQAALLSHFDAMMPDETRALREYHQWQSYDNFFATLYYLFDGLRPRLQQGLLDEAQRGIEQVCRAMVERLTHATADAPRGDLQRALMDALGDQFGAMLAQVHASPERLDALKQEVFALANAVMVASWAGLPLPIDLALRLVRTDTMLAYKETLRAAPFIRELEDAQADFYLQSRHPLEADLWCRKQLPSWHNKFEIVKQLALTLRQHEVRDDRSPSLDFVVKLLQAVGPQGREKCRLTDSFMGIAETVSTLAEMFAGEIHPRLLLVQANAVREGVRERQRALANNSGASADEVRREVAVWFEKLKAADAALLGAQDYVSSRSVGGRLAAGARNFLVVAKTERAAVLGAQLGSLRELSRRVPIEAPRLKADADDVFRRARHAWRDSLSLDDENHQTFDIASWIIRDRLDLGQMSDEERLDALAEWKYLLEGYAEAVETPDQSDRYDARDRECALRRGDSVAAAAVLDRMLARGSVAAHSLRAREIELRDGPSGGARAARKYLETSCASSLDTDRHVLLLYYRLWWASETGFAGYFPHDHIVLAFDDARWARLAQLAEARLRLEGESTNRLAMFHLAWSQMQRGDATASLATFRNLASITEGAFRRGRSLAVVSDAAGAPRVFRGENRGSHDGVRGRVWIDDLRQELPYNALDFEDADRRAGAPFGPFHIAMNYRGPFAQPIHRTSSRRA